MYYPEGKKTSRFKEISDLDAAWLAGLLEGEGCFVRSGPRNKDGTQTVAVKLRMTDKDVVDKAGILMGARTIRDVDRSSTGRKMVYEAAVFGNTAKDVMQRVFPFMGERRKERISEFIG